MAKTIKEMANEYVHWYTDNDNGNGGDDWEDDIAITYKAGADAVIDEIVSILTKQENDYLKLTEILKKIKELKAL